MPSPRSVEAVRDCPGPAIGVEWHFDVGTYLVDLSPTSLSQRMGHHDDKQQDDEKRSPTEIRDDGSGSLPLYFKLSFLII